MPKIVDHEARRWDICATAAQLIASGGLDAATFRDIAEASGYSKGVIEHYFNGKDELISGALDWANRRYEQRVTRATAGLDGLASLRKRIAATLPMTPAERDEWKVRLVFWSLAAIDEGLREQQQGRFARAIAYFEGDIAAAIARDEIAALEDAGVAARHLVNMTTGICVAALHNRKLYTRAALQAEVDYLLGQLPCKTIEQRELRSL